MCFKIIIAFWAQPEHPHRQFDHPLDSRFRELKTARKIAKTKKYHHLLQIPSSTEQWITQTMNRIFLTNILRKKTLTMQPINLI